MKRAFTFVEIAIVLVVFGIIVGLSFKGRSLIETANLRSEVNKIRKIQTSLLGWLNSNDSGQKEMVTVFPRDNVSTFSITSLKDLSKDDLIHPFGTWTLKSGLMPDNGTLNIISNDGVEFILEADGVSSRFACNVEMILDNKNFSTGLGRAEGIPAGGLYNSTSGAITRQYTLNGRIYELSVACEPEAGWSEVPLSASKVYYKLF